MILKAVPADTTDLVKLVNSAYRSETSATGWTSESHLLEGDRIDSGTMLGYLTDPKINMLKYLDAEGNIKGCIYLEVKADRVYLGMLSVSPLEQARGIGRELITASKNFCREQHCIGLQLTVIDSRKELIGWYKRRGFYETGEILPFRIPEKFGKAKMPISLMVMNSDLT